MHTLQVRLGAIGAPLIFALIWWLPLPLAPLEQRMAAIFAAVVIAWVTEVIPLPVTAFLIAPAMVAAGITSAEKAFYPYADPILFLFVGGFFLAQAMSLHGLDRRLAKGLLSLPWVRGSERRSLWMLIVTAALMSMWVSNTATTAMLFPIAVGGLQTLSADRNRRATTSPAAWMLGVAYASTIGGLATLVGTPPNPITARLLSAAGYSFGFVDWLRIGLPASVVVLAALIWRMLRMPPPRGDGSEQVALPAGVVAIAVPEPLEHRGWSRGERVTAACFSLAVIGWTLPAIAEACGWKGAKSLGVALPGGSVALIAALPLFLWRAKPGGDLVLPWSEANRIDWGTIFLFGGGISLGTQVSDTGLARTLAQAFVELTGVSSLWSLTALVVVFTVLFTEVCSNTAAATIVVPLVIAAAVDLGVSPIPPALAAGLMASSAYMMPVGTASNAIAYGSGMVPMRTMLRHGLWLDVVSGALIFATLRILCPLYGWD